MHIIIIGAGEVGCYLAEILIEEHHDVCIVEQDEKLARELDDRLDAQIVHGTGVSREALFRAGINKADLLLAVTQVDEVNLVAAMTAERMHSKCATVARVRDRRYLFGNDALQTDEYGVDLLIGPEQAVADQVVQLLQYEGPGQISRISDGKVTLLELPVMPHSTLVYATLEELTAELPDQSRIAAILGSEGLRLATPQDRLNVGERLFVLCAPERMHAFLTLAGIEEHQVHRVLIIGGGEIGFAVSRVLQRLKFDITLAEIDAERAEQIAAKLTRTTVILGDGTDPTLMNEQLRDGQDAVVVLLDDDEKSLLAGIMAKHLGARKVVARVDKRAYAPLAHKLGVDALISPRRAVADSILRFVRRGHITSTTMLGDHQGELIDFRISKKPKKEISGVPIGDLKLPAGSTIGVIVRGDQVILPCSADDTIQPEDHVFVVALRDAVSGVEALFE
ncbi:MAG: trk system potassium uptake protein TrkA [Hyphomicrobiaceae bacterium]|jgi:trk system potassium uptake protein TrkA